MSARPYCDHCLDTLFWCDFEEALICDCPTATAKRQAAEQENEDMEHDRKAA